MTEGTRRERLRAETEREIRVTARALLVNQGREAVTLRAIARVLGITAPALYRYYDSLDDLLQQLRTEICADLAEELNQDLRQLSTEGVVDQVYAVCRGFRRWALAHPQEFGLVFASPAGRRCAPTNNVDQVQSASVNDQVGQAFFEVAARVLATIRPHVLPDDHVPEALHTGLLTFGAALQDKGTGIPDHALRPGILYGMLRFWVRLYGHVAHEVFNRFPFEIITPEPLFESMLAELVVEFGLTSPAGTHTS
jgi:AcrR family transcriptional regulator